MSNQQSQDLKPVCVIEKLIFFPIKNVTDFIIKDVQTEHTSWKQVKSQLKLLIPPSASPNPIPQSHSQLYNRAPTAAPTPYHLWISQTFLPNLPPLISLSQLQIPACTTIITTTTTTKKTARINNHSSFISLSINSLNPSPTRYRLTEWM